MTCLLFFKIRTLNFIHFVYFKFMILSKEYLKESKGSGFLVISAMFSFVDIQLTLIIPAFTHSLT